LLWRRGVSLSGIYRITKSNGFIIISLPNIQSFYTRLQFLFTGTFYGFVPENYRHPKGRLVDRGHISPMTFVHLTYLFGEYDFKPQFVTGDKIKKWKLLFLFYGILYIINVIVLFFRRRKTNNPDLKLFYKQLASFKCLMGRSFIGVWSKSKLNNF